MPESAEETNDAMAVSDTARPPGLASASAVCRRQGGALALLLVLPFGTTAAALPLAASARAARALSPPQSRCGISTTFRARGSAWGGGAAGACGGGDAACASFAGRFATVALSSAAARAPQAPAA
jgi:hypothetical protein